MSEIRGGNMYISTMIREIKESMSILESGYIHKRAMRQLVDGANFLDMLAKTPYVGLKRVSELKEKISEERNLKKERLAKIESYLPEHQMTLFPELGELSKDEISELEKEYYRLDHEIHWLHKCLGICSNRNYFS